MSENGIKLGQLLCDEDVITKRQLSKALQEQVKGKKGTLGEILVDMGVCSFEDITDAMMNHSSDVFHDFRSSQNVSSLGIVIVLPVFYLHLIIPEVDTSPKLTHFWLV